MANKNAMWYHTIDEFMFYRRGNDACIGLESVTMTNNYVLD